MLHAVTTGAYYPPVVTTWKILTTGAFYLTTGTLCSVVQDLYVPVYICTTELQSKLHQKFTALSYDIHPAVITFLALNT